MSDSLYDVIFDYVVENQHAAMDVTVTKYTDGLRDAVIEWAKSEDAVAPDADDYSVMQCAGTWSSGRLHAKTTKRVDIKATSGSFYMGCVYRNGVWNDTQGNQCHTSNIDMWRYAAVQA